VACNITSAVLGSCECIEQHSGRFHLFKGHKGP